MFLAYALLAWNTKSSFGYRLTVTEGQRSFVTPLGVVFSTLRIMIPPKGRAGNDGGFNNCGVFEYLKLVNFWVLTFDFLF